MYGIYKFNNPYFKNIKINDQIISLKTLRLVSEGDYIEVEAEDEENLNITLRNLDILNLQGQLDEGWRQLTETRAHIYDKAEESYPIDEFDPITLDECPEEGQLGKNNSIFFNGQWHYFICEEMGEEDNASK